MEETSVNLVDNNLTLADMLRTNAHLLQLEMVEKAKMSWDRMTPATEFNVGNVVQYYHSKLDESWLLTNKLLPRWSMPSIISGKSLNSFTLTTLHSTQLKGSFHSRWLQHYIPLCGSNLHLLQTNEARPPNHNPYETELQEAEKRMMETEW